MPRPPLTRLLLVVFVLVLHRAVEMRTGWPDWLVLPAVALMGAIAFDLVESPRHLLQPRRLLFYVVGAVGVGALVAALM